MHEAVRVPCGELATSSVDDTNTIRLDVGAPEGTAERVNLCIEQISTKMVANIPDRLVDLLEIAAYVYAADQLKTRGGDAMRGLGRDWRREFRFDIPVRDVEFWRRRATTAALQATLGFLADDYYRFTFKLAKSPRSIEDYLALEPDGPPVGFVPDRIALFSGGLDSLAGVAAGLLQKGERLAVVSHSASTAVQGRQEELIGDLRARCPDRMLFHIGVRVTRGLEEPREFTQRTRSFLFASLAFVIARLFGKNEITFYENGIVSVNLPIAEHIVGARATRTTHPKTLVGFATLFGMIADEQVRVVNPFFWQTKADVLRRIADAGVANLIARSFSCSHVRLWVMSGQQCGVCTQCIDRRFAVLAAGLDAYDPKEGYRTDLLIGARDDGKEVVVAESFVLSARRFSAFTQTGLFGRHGELLRVLPYLGGDMGSNATRLFELYRSHGRNVVRVVDNALGETTLDSILALPRTCLLSLIRSHVGQHSESLRDPIEFEPRLDERSEASSAKPAPLAVSLNHRRGLAMVGAIELRGASFKLIDSLATHRFERSLQHANEGDSSFLTTKRLAGQLSIGMEAVRRRVLKCRNQLRDGFQLHHGVPIAEDAVIQNNRGHGYRLNPDVHVKHHGGSDFPVRKSEVTTFAVGSRQSSQVLKNQEVTDR